MMPVDIIEHFLTGMKQRVQRADAFMGHDNTSLPMHIGMDSEGGLQPSHIDTPIRHIAGTSITREVIKLVYIERTAQ